MKKSKEKKAYHAPCDHCDEELYTFLEFTNDELVALWKKLQYKVNPVWVSLREKIEKEAKYIGLCLYCGTELD